MEHPSPFVQLAVTKAIKDAATANEKAVKAHLETVMAAGDRKTANLGDRDLGTVSYSKASPSARVTDRDAFTAWVTDAHPTEVGVAVTVDADVLMAAMLHLHPDHEPKDQEQRALWEVAYGTILSTVTTATPQVRPAYEQAILANVVKAKAPVDPATGEVIPGVAYDKGGQGLSIACRLSEAQRQELTDAYVAGELDLIALATTPPAELPGPDSDEEQAHE